MLLSEFLVTLQQVEQLRFKTPDGLFIPAHFHITEVGKVEKHFIDCGGVERKEAVVNFQLWSSTDVDHRLSPQKVRDIVGLAIQKLEIEDQPIEVEYQANTIGKYGISFDGAHFQLTATQTDCLAKSECGLPEPSEKGNCAPGSNCC